MEYFIGSNEGYKRYLYFKTMPKLSDQVITALIKNTNQIFTRYVKDLNENQKIEFLDDKNFQELRNTIFLNAVNIDNACLKNIAYDMDQMFSSKNPELADEILERLNFMGLHNTPYCEACNKIQN